MARRQDSMKHPALAAKAIEKKAGEQLVKLEGVDEWYRLTDQERRFLTFYIQCRDGLKAAREVGIDAKWIEHREAVNPAFEVFLGEIMAHPRALAELILEDLLPESTQKLADLMYQDSNPSVQLGAIKHIHNVTQMLPDQKAQGPTVNVNLFDMGEHGARVVEGEVSNGHH